MPATLLKLNVARLPSVNRAEEVARELRNQIRAGALSPRVRLPSEHKMAAQFGVSRAVIREAVARLRNEGLVKTRQGSGAYVRDNDISSLNLDPDIRKSLKSVLAIVELRKGIEAEAAALAAERRTRKDLIAIEKALAQIARITREGGDSSKADILFHRAIAEAAHNPYYIAVLDYLSQWKRIPREPSGFGRGAIEGVAGPESANNAAAQTNFIPMLTLGIPANALMAMMMGALTIHGIQPGPHLLTLNATVFWGLVVSMWIGNVMLLIINLPLINIWVSFLRIRYSAIYVGILVLSVIGVYTVSNSVIDVYLTILFGVVGSLLLRFGFEPAPLLLGFVLGKLMETHFRKAMIQSGGDPMIFVERPISCALLVLSAGLVLLLVSPTFRGSREIF